ncbi:cytochrome P450 [Trametes meyenii]|nr:cytochrome P450 [Trametes meyenii]
MSTLWRTFCKSLAHRQNLYRLARAPFSRNRSQVFIRTSLSFHPHTMPLFDLPPDRVFILVASFVSIWIAALPFIRRVPAVPPGPKGLPILGNVHQLPEKFQEKTLLRWSREYGDIMYLKFFRTPTIVLSSVEAARDLLDKRSAKYSDRPPMLMFTDLIGMDSSLPTIPYGARMRKHRKWIRDAVGHKETLQSYRPLQRRAVHVLLRNLSEDPGRFLDHLHLYLGSLMLQITYGRQVSSTDDHLFQLAEKAIYSANGAGTAGSVIVDFVPVLKHLPTWFPGAGFKRRGLEARKHWNAWRDYGYDEVMASVAAGTANPCIYTSVLEQYEMEPSEEDINDIKGLSINVHGAGFESSLATFTNFLLDMTRNPHVYRKAQEEMDQVIGDDRLPDFDDRESLSYLDAIIEEVLRWQPSVPMGMPHRVTTDDHYRGYHIPAGSMVIANTWALTRDERYYPEPDQFRPERHLKSDTEDKEILLPSSFVFGFGRRVCPGQALAEANLWLAMAHIIALFDIHKPLDGAGNEFTPLAVFSSGVTNQPAPFECRITPRSDKAVALLGRLDR